jgi:S1-C subfamily serine protease
MGTLLALSNDLAAAVAHAGRALVAVNGRRRLPSTGIHWRSGIVVTAHHTVRIDDEITVTDPDGRTVPVTLAGRDPSSDLAVLKLHDAGDLTVADLADSVAGKVGQMVLALGYGPRASLGIISARGGQSRAERGEADRLLCSDLVLYPGFSGGPLVDTEGRVLGVNTSGLSREIPLAIPAVTVTRLTEELLQKGYIARGYLGFGLQPVRLPDTLTRALGLPRSAGLVVISLEPAGPAERAGLLIGDVLVELDGKPVMETDDVMRVLGAQRVGSTLRASVVRAGVRTDVALTVGERPRRSR